MTFTYTSAPLADANIIDPTTGTSLGTTDADGHVTVTVPESGIVAIGGLAAIMVAPPEAAAAGMSWEEAADYIGEEITVCGPIVDNMDIGGPLLLGMGVSAADSATVGIEIVVTLLAEMPEDMYVGKEICVTGEIYTNIYGTPTIDVTDPSQIAVQE